MATQIRGTQQLRDLSLRLRAMGKEGKGLQRELYRAIREAAKPFERQISSAEYLKPYMPDRYAEVLAGDMSVSALNRGGESASVRIRVKGQRHRRQVERIDAGILRHPVFAERGTPRKSWRWVTQTEGMRPGFFTDAVRSEADFIRGQVQQAMDEVAKKITS